MRITALAGGIGGARFLRGLLHHLNTREGQIDVTVIGNTADDITLHGLRVCPDLDTVMYTLGGGIHHSQGWGREDEKFTVSEELAAYGAEPSWFTLGDRDLATHIVRTRLLGQGMSLSQVTASLCERWQPGVRLLPMSDARIETHVVIDDPDAGLVPEDVRSPSGEAPGTRAVHFQEWWVRMHASVPARRILAVGLDQAKPAPGVLEAIREADVILLPPSNPVVSIGMILGVPGIRDAMRATRAPVVGISPIISGAPYAAWPTPA
jgi:LPPG:FO 2-phospho-L-lactate transferase